MNALIQSVATATLLFVLAPAVGLAQDLFFDSAGVRIRYVDQGRGDVVILLHGNGNTLQSWVDSGVLKDLARDHRVLAFDARGHGRSGKPHEVSAYGPEMGLDAIRLLDHLRIRNAHVIGYSMGAQIAAQLVTSHGDRFITLTLGGAPGRFRWSGAEDERTEREASETERECVSRSQIYRLAPVNEPKPSDEEIKRRSEACMADSGRDRFALAAVSRAGKNRLVTPAQVAAVRVPTLSVVGSLDGYLADFRELKKLQPDMTLIVIDGATHGGERGAMRRPEFLAAVRSLLSANKAAVADH